jgi:hypothetical protein
MEKAVVVHPRPAILTRRNVFHTIQQVDVSLSRFNASLELTLIDIFDLWARMKIAQVPFPQRCMLTRLRMRVVLYTPT